jgi:hypothetical protein
MRYTLTAKPIDGTLIYTGPPNEMISLYEYLGYRSPEKGIGERIHSKAKEVDATISHKEVSTAKYTGKILLYERGCLDMYYNAFVLFLSIVLGTYPEIIEALGDMFLSRYQLPPYLSLVSYPCHLSNL